MAVARRVLTIALALGVILTAAPQPATCPQCHKEVGGDFAFCPHCGSKMSQA